MPPKPPTIVDLTWIGDLKFSAVSGKTSMTIDGASTAGPSPVQALAFALAGCMAADVVYMLTKKKHPLQALQAHLVAKRAEEDPHRLVDVELRLDIEGAVPHEDIERATVLSREKYCSVWHSLNPDIDFRVTIESDQ